MLFGANNMVKDNDKEKYMYSGYEMAFDGKGSLSFNDAFARNVTILGVDNSSSSHTENVTSAFSPLGKGDTFGINESFDAPEKIISNLIIN